MATHTLLIVIVIARNSDNIVCNKLIGVVAVYIAIAYSIIVLCPLIIYSLMLVGGSGKVGAHTRDKKTEKDKLEIRK